uniref:Fibroin-like protein n=1 Tax=Oryza rufipogon TaxID=4529 RepID=A0A679BED5_ORYRU|nr:fibroin-like protein [Oryza rufipogon]
MPDVLDLQASPHWSGLTMEEVIGKPPCRRAPRIAGAAADCQDFYPFPCRRLILVTIPTPQQPFTKHRQTNLRNGNHLTSAHDRGHGCSNSFTNPFPKFSTNNGVCGIFGIRAQRARIPRKEKYLWNIGKDILKNIFDSLTSGVNKKGAGVGGGLATASDGGCESGTARARRARLAAVAALQGGPRGHRDGGGAGNQGEEGGRWPGRHGGSGRSRRTAERGKTEEWNAAGYVEQRRARCGERGGEKKGGVFSAISGKGGEEADGKLTDERGAALATRRESWRGGRDGGAGASSWRPATMARVFRVRRRRNERGGRGLYRRGGEGLGIYQGKLKEKSWKRFKRNTWVFVLGNIGWSQGKDSRRDLNNSGFVEVFGEDSKEGFEF